MQNIVHISLQFACMFVKSHAVVNLATAIKWTDSTGRREVTAFVVAPRPASEHSCAPLLPTPTSISPLFLSINPLPLSSDILFLSKRPETH
ncbi:hypothetical protein EVAR_23042_1 [Eumeta japonica]|uniref:Secreted protein n=1 Tax=Eumeta variegata TaxID=151549 RepID=A0A4C1URD0_EUMVA|nr:hypothetical protein EVAR_23042_1 [Eumeta japonica]